MDSDNNDNNTNNSITNVGKKTIYSKLGVPGSIILDNKTYIFKEKLKSVNDTFTYRCKNFKCRVPIRITFDNLKKINDKNNKDKIEYISNKPHKCNSEVNLIKEDPEKCATNEEIIDKAKKLIALNPLQSLSYHKSKLEEMNLKISDSNINRLIYQIRNQIFPSDEDTLKYINNITITYDEKLLSSKDLPFCPVYNRFINPSKKNRVESFIIITSIFLLKY